MLAWLIGPLDVPAASAVAIFCICVAVGVTTYIGRYQSQYAIQTEADGKRYQLELQDRQQERIVKKERDIELAQFGMRKEIEFKKIDSGLVEVSRNKVDLDRG